MSGASISLRVILFTVMASILGCFVVLVAWAGDVSGAALPTAIIPAVGTGTPACGLQWSVVPSQNTGNGYNSLSDVDAVSPNDIWAVGSYTTTLSDERQPLIQHWNGAAWSLVPSPGPVGLNSVAAISTNDVWAVGYTGQDRGPFQTVIEHWNGTTWSIVPSPNPGSVGGKLTGISALSANDVWAAGFYVNGNQSVTLVLHWDGSIWEQIPSPNAAFNTELSNITALSANDVWAVGAYVALAPPPTHYVQVTMHWDGLDWTVITPDPNMQGYLYAVEGTSSNDVWAIGYVLVTGSIRTLALHWDGAAWTQVTTPNPGLAYNFLYSISVLSTNEVWAVGLGGGTLTIRWNGTAWSQVPSPNVDGGGNLAGVAALSSGDVWAVGDYYTQNDGTFNLYQSLIEHYADPCLVFTPTPTVSSTGTPTNTTIPTNTRTSTPSRTATSIPTATFTSTPTVEPVLVGHVNWQARPAQPDGLQVLPITLTLKSGVTEINYPTQFTDPNGFFTVTLGGLPNGTYGWRADNSASALHSPNYLANSGTVNLTGASVTNIEMGLMRAGDANNDNVVSVLDFNILKVSFGTGCGNPNYDNRADFTGDCIVNITDYNPLKANFGLPGAPPLGPGRR